MWSAGNDLRLSPLLSVNELQRQFCYRAANKLQTHTKARKKEQQWQRHCQCACVCHCLDVKYHSRCRKHWVHAVVGNVLLELGNKTKQKCNLFWRHHTLSRAKPNTMAQKEVESSPKTQIEILIIKHARPLRCIARVRKSVKMIACSATNRTAVKTISVDIFSVRKKTAD